jgi:hypothetical protein
VAAVNRHEFLRPFVERREDIGERLAIRTRRIDTMSVEDIASVFEACRPAPTLVSAATRSCPSRCRTSSV